MNRSLYYDCAILDWQMPAMDGIALARILKADPAFRAIPLVMLTSVGLTGDEAAARAAGLAAYVSKPIRQAQLCNCLLAVRESRAAGGSGARSSGATACAGDARAPPRIVGGR